MTAASSSTFNIHIIHEFTFLATLSHLSIDTEPMLIQRFLFGNDYSLILVGRLDYQSLFEQRAFGSLSAAAPYLAFSS